MNQNLNSRFPSVADIETAALGCLPKMVRDYIYCGMGRGGCVRRNRDALKATELLPRYAVDADVVSTRCELLGRNYAAPFGVGPVGFGGLAWPAAQDALARAAKLNEIPFTLATFGLSSLERVRELSGEYSWFQLYRPKDPEIESDLLTRVTGAGYEVLIVTVDVPYATRRDHDLRNGFGVRPQLNVATVVEILSHPRWAMAYALNTLQNGLPRFQVIERYVPPGLSTQEKVEFIATIATGHVTPAVLRGIREQWSGSLVVKGVLAVDDALAYRDAGADAIVVSNHGGRQLEAAPATAKVLPKVRAALGENFPLIVDGGVRSGLDICRMLALGADFVLLGRPFYYAVAAMGPAGAEHVVAVLKTELDCAMGQLGCSETAELRERLG